MLKKASCPDMVNGQWSSEDVQLEERAEAADTFHDVPFGQVRVSK
jgi:hypothetical protein